MAMQTSTSSNDNLLMTYFEKRAIATLHDQVAFYQIAEKYPLPKNSGKSIVFNGWRTLAAASGALSEYSASANAAVRLSSRKVSATIVSYGRSIQVTDFLELTSILPVEPGALRELEQSAALTADNVIQMAVFGVTIDRAGALATTTILSAWLSSTTSAFCANTSTASYNANSARQFGFPVVFGTSAARLSAMHAASASTTSISACMGPIGVRKAVARLKRLNVPPMANGKYVGITHPNAVASMLSNSDFKTWQTGYAEGPKETMYKHMVGTVHGVDFIESANAPRFEGAGTGRSHKIDLTFICGKGAVASTELDGGIKMIMHRPGPQTISDPYELYATLAYKLRAVGAVLNPSCGVILMSQEYFG